MSTHSGAGTATLWFAPDLAAIARRVDVRGRATVWAGPPRSVKDAVEACGVPHTEVDLLLADGQSVGFCHRLGRDDEVEVIGHRDARPPGAVSRVRPAALRPTRFVCDVHLGRLAGKLRLLGFDTAYRNDADDPDLAALAARERRWLLSRDRGLLMRSAVTHGYLVRAQRPQRQVREVVDRFGLSGQNAPLTRCAHCNGLLAPVSKDEIAHRLEPGTHERHDQFVRCRRCDQLYWPGSHMAGILKWTAGARPA